MIEDPYLDPDTGVLRNRLGCTSTDHLAQAEADLSYAALAELDVRSLPGRYDLHHLRAFHWYIFRDVYAWADELRTVAIAKSAPFCLPLSASSPQTQGGGWTGVSSTDIAILPPPPRRCLVTSSPWRRCSTSWSRRSVEFPSRYRD